MQHADQVAYLERMLSMVRTNTRDDGPGVSHTSVEEYYDPARFKREVDLLFRHHPIVVAFSGQVRKPGDFVVHNDTGQPILVVRGTDGVLRAFLNVCRHRSASVEVKPCGSNKRAFVCPYHGWSYDLTGRLVGITDGATFGDVDKSKHGLRRLKVAEKYGLIWVVPTALEEGEAASLDIDPYLGALKADLAGWDMQGWELHSSEPMRPRMNWKLVIDTFLELYHFRYLHPGNGVPAVPRQHRDLRTHGPATSAWRPPSARSPSSRASPRRLAHPRPRHRALSALPQHGADLHPGSLRRVHQLSGLARRIGDAASRCWSVPRRRPRSPRATGRPTVDLFATALGEDFAIGETIQRNFRSGANSRQTFGKFEKALGWYHKEVERRR